MCKFNILSILVCFVSCYSISMQPCEERRSIQENNRSVSPGSRPRLMPAELFGRGKKVRYITLGDDRLESLPISFLEGLEKLRWLYLDDDRIESKVSADLLLHASLSEKPDSNKKEKIKKGNCKGVNCPICLSAQGEVEKNEHAESLCCHQFFCRNCIAICRACEITCPLCRSEKF